MRDPLKDPQPGDVVEAKIRGEKVTREVLLVEYNTVSNMQDVAYVDSRHIGIEKSSWIHNWRRWCKKHNAKVKV